MFQNYIKSALRNLIKNRLYAFINTVGLSLGLAVYVFGWVLADYERSHDQNFENAGRIYTIGSKFSASVGAGVLLTDSTYTAFGPIVDTALPEVEAMARTVNNEFLLTIGDDSYYQEMRFTDPAFTRIFDFDFIAGDASVLEEPSSVLITETTANRYFPDGDALGKTMLIDNKHPITVGAVVKDLPANTHFNSSLVSDQNFEVVGSFNILNQVTGYDLAGNWSNLSLGDITYVLLSSDRDQSWLQSRINELYEQHFPEDEKENVAELLVKPLHEINTILWDAIGMPVIASIQVLALAVLIIACVNYTNLAIAQSMGRAREVGLRRTLGANKTQLLTQFLTESLAISFIAMIVAVVLLEMTIPVFNQALGKVLALNYSEILPWLALSTILVGVFSGLYPAYHISRTQPIDALQNTTSKGGKGTILRSLMIGAQFVISIFMLVAVVVMYFQNQRVRETINIFPTEQLVTLGRMHIEGVTENKETLRNELLRIPGVVNVSFMSQIPFDQSNSRRQIGPQRGDESNAFRVNLNRIDPQFLSTLDIPLLAGRNFNIDIANDTLVSDQLSVNVIVNELTLKKLGYNDAQDALGKTFYNYPEEGAPREHTIVGVVKDQNFLGLHNEIKPFMFMMNSYQPWGVVRIQSDNVQETLTAVDATWKKLIPSYPIQRQFLDEVFENVYAIFRSLNMAFTGFAGLAVLLALIGLFGLAAFMAEQRTKEIGLRKVLGANSYQIIGMLIWQFSKPVVLALLVALPLSYISTELYLGFFSDRIDLPIFAILIAGGGAVFLSWVIVAGHAARVANTNPIQALRYE